jgi:hypothetical protein
MCFSHGKVISTRMPAAAQRSRKPARRGVIYTQDVQADLTHQRQISIDLLRPSEIMSLRVRPEGPVGDPFNEKFAVALKRISRPRESASLRSLPLFPSRTGALTQSFW